MTRQQYTEHDPVRRYPRQERQENPGVGSKKDFGPERGEEVSLRIETPGYGGASLSAVVPAETLSEIETGDRPVEAMQSPESGAERMQDALVGGAVALLVSQVLFPPSPVSLLKEYV